jgi:uncharacterized protein YdiU (UPF0061 family)
LAVDAPITAEQPYCALLDAVAARQARLVARWMLIGFILDAMNTDNTSIGGRPQQTSASTDVLVT